MPNDRPTVRVGRILASPGPAIRTSAFEPYVAAVGRLNYAWNNLHETLSKLFVAIASPTLPNIILSVWHSTRSDRGQRDMLLAALVASPEDRWSPRLPGPRNALIWLVQRVDELAGCGFKRPCRGRRSGAALRQGSAPARRPTPQPRVTFLNDRNSDISIWWRQPTTGAGPFPCCLRFAYFPALRPGHPLNRRTGAASG